MTDLRSLSFVAGVVLLAVASAPRAQERPALVPTKDVDISYKVTRPNQPAIIERRRWLAGEHLERVDGPDKSTTIFDRNKGEFILLNAGSKTFRKLEGKGDIENVATISANISGGVSGCWKSRQGRPINSRREKPV